MPSSGAGGPCCHCQVRHRQASPGGCPPPHAGMVLGTGLRAGVRGLAVATFEGGSHHHHLRPTHRGTPGSLAALGRLLSAGRELCGSPGGPRALQRLREATRRGALAPPAPGPPAACRIIHPIPSLLSLASTDRWTHRPPSCPPAAAAGAAAPPASRCCATLAARDTSSSAALRATSRCRRGASKTRRARLPPAALLPRSPAGARRRRLPAAPPSPSAPRRSGGWGVETAAGCGLTRCKARVEGPACSSPPTDRACAWCCLPARSAAESDAWSSDLEEEELSGASASLEGDSDSGTASTRATRGAARRQRSTSPTKALKANTSYITSQTQLQVCGSRGAPRGVGLGLSARTATGLPAPPDMRAPVPPSAVRLQEIHSADISVIAGAFFASSLRLKPRKPVVVTVSAVW